jgi:hypothetical protein
MKPSEDDSSAFDDKITDMDDDVVEDGGEDLEDDMDLDETDKEYGFYKEKEKNEEIKDLAGLDK